jgi:subtilisin family serine protease
MRACNWPTLSSKWAAYAAVLCFSIQPLYAATPSTSVAGSNNGSTNRSRFGPFRTESSTPVPKHAFSPFARESKISSAKPTEKDYAKGSVLFKLAPPENPRLKARYGNVSDEKLLADTLARHGLGGHRRVFENVSEARRQAMAREHRPDITRWHRVNLAEGKTVGEVLKALSEDPAIEYAEPDLIRRMADLPDGSSDPRFGEQWHLPAIHAPEAWAYLQSQGLPPGGSPDIVVAVIDTGVDLNHPDLAANLWTGQHGEHGRDVIAGTDSPMDDNGHGTHVAGIIAATGLNHEGGVGVAYGVKIMAIKAAQYSGVLTVSDIAAGIYYAVENGADVINMSFGGYFESQVEEDALLVAFGQAVLVAAAGNDSTPTLPAPSPCDPHGLVEHRNFYPAAYNWVLGVEASKPDSDPVNGFRAPFSNYDCVPNDTAEYEVLAPGQGILSTFPNAKFATWSGTSMAAPVVSGVAALLRTKFPDKATFSSRFIMGQIATQGANPSDPSHKNVINALQILTATAQPRLSYLADWLFDSTALSTNNNNNGIVDSGETIDVGLRIRNQWGAASQISVTLDPTLEGAAGPDPYITMLVSNVNYGALGSFSELDNGLTNDAQGTIVGVTNPFRFRVDPATPNDHVIPFRVIMTCRDGLNPADTTLFSFTNHFNVMVQRGRQVPHLIATNFALTPDYYWLANSGGGGTLVEAGATLRIEPGTQVEFTTGIALEAGASLVVEGTATNPVELFPNALVVNGEVMIGTISGIHDAAMSYRYARIASPATDNLVDLIDHCYLTYTAPYDRRINVTQVSNTIFHYMKLQSPGGGYNFLSAGSVSGCLFDHCYMMPPSGNPSGGNTFLLDYGGPATPGPFHNNAVLNRWSLPLPYDWTAYPTNWMCFLAPYPRTAPPLDLSSNFWGTTVPALIKGAIFDFDDSFSYAGSIIDPLRTNAPANCYPFVSDVRIRNSSGQISPIIGAETATFEIEFNRDMNTNIAPQVTFGPAEPYSDFSISGVGSGWTNSRVWVGSFNVTPLTGDGFQYLRIAGGVAADDPWLVTGNDAARFQFQISATTSESLNLQASGGEGFIDLSWMQDDFELLAGFNLYRSTSPNGGFSRINPGIIPPDQRSWRDSVVTPGTTYYYKFTVLKTDLGESDFSNLASAAPLDTIPPVINHTALTSAQAGLPLTIVADVTDNVGVQSVTLYFRPINGTNYLARSMTLTTGNRYAGTIEASRLVAPGIQYYIAASDGISTVSSGRPEAPYTVTVNDQPSITAVTPNQGTASGGTAVTLGGANFKSGATVSFGGVSASNVVVVGSSQITCVTPPHFPASVDVTIANPNGGSGTALNAYAYQSDVASISLPNTAGPQQTIVAVPINAANLIGVAAASLTVTFDPTVLRARGARAADLSPGWYIVANTNSAGQIRISMASPGNTSNGSGILAYLDFDVIGAPNSSTALAIASILLNDGAVPVQTANGSFTVNRVFNVSGSARYWQGNVPVPGVTATLSGNSVYGGTSGTNGSFTVAGAPAGDYTLTLSKSNDANGITAFDASLALQHDAGLITLTGSAAMAADVNKSGYISALDAFYILQKSVGVISLPFPGAGKVWQFQPDSRSVPGLAGDLSGQDFTAILLGDISGNWDPNQLLGTQPSSPVTVALKTLVTTRPPATNVWLVLNSPDAVVYSIDLTLSYDPVATRVRSIQTGPLGQTFAIASNTNQPGIIRAALAGAVPLRGIGGMLLFDVGASPAANLQITNISINEGLITAQIDPGGASFEADTDGDGQSDWTEIRAGTDPLNPGQYLGIQNVIVNADGSRTIQVSSVAGKIYQLQYLDDLSASVWSNLGGELTAVSGAVLFRDPAPNPVHRFYRIKLVE